MDEHEGFVAGYSGWPYQINASEAWRAAYWQGLAFDAADNEEI